MARLHLRDFLIQKLVIHGDLAHLGAQPINLLISGVAGALLTLLVELNRMGKTVLIATHDLNLIRQAKTEVAARVLRIGKGGIQLAGADL